MGKAAKRNAQLRMEDAHEPRASDLQRGTFDRATMTGTVPRAANCWRELPGRRVACDLCYRRCELRPGEAGWCGYRRNDGGRMAIPDHAILSRSQRLQIGAWGGIHTFLPGAVALGVGATRCTARCAFCTSANAVWDPAAIPWPGGRDHALGGDGGWWLAMKAVLHPESVIESARRKGARVIVFAENEPTLSYEFTYDVARLAKEAGLSTVIYSNGFTTPDAIRALAPVIDCVDIGIKGSLDETFYATKMRAPGGAEAVKRGLVAWQEAGIGYLLISDLIATHYQQDDDTQEAASAHLYDWIAANLGPHTPIMMGHMHPVDGSKAAEKYTYLLPPRLEELARYHARLIESYERAQAAGLAYTHYSNAREQIDCHACGGLLLERHAPKTPDGRLCGHPDGSDHCTMFTTGCGCWSHTQHVTNRRCDHCGAPVPIVTLPREELAR